MATAATVLGTQLIHWLDAAPDAAPATLGGKAAPLARLAKLGLRVPLGFVIAPAAFPLDGDDAQAAREEIRQAYAELARRLAEAAPPAQAAAPGTTSGATASQPASNAQPPEPLVAVRSSATAEDLAEASFAGQYETFLGVRGAAEVVDAARRCWDSLWTPHAVAYRERAEAQARAAGRTLPPPEMAVLVQALVQADAAGVAFTADPVTGAANAVTINAAWGLGQSIVDGEVEADTWKIDRRTREVLAQTTGHKETRTGLGVDAGDGSGAPAERVAVPEELQDRPCLTPEQAQAVAALALEAEAAIGGPADVEWAIEGETLWLLQARPITTGVTPAQSNGAAGAAPTAQTADAPPAPPAPPAPVGPSPSFPFTWPDAEAATLHWKLQPSDLIKRPLRQDTSSTFQRSFPNSEFLKGRDHSSRAIWVNGRFYVTRAPAAGTPEERAARKAAFERAGTALTELGQTYLQTVVFPEVDEGNARLGAVDPFRLPPAELARHVEECFRWYERAWTLHWMWSPDSPGKRFQKLYAEVKGIPLKEDGNLPDEHEGEAESLLTHEPNLFSEAIDGLIDLARIAQRHAGVSDLLMSRTAVEALAVVRRAAGAAPDFSPPLDGALGDLPPAPDGTDEFGAAFAALLERQGLRCGAGFGTETDEMNPSWREDPTVVIELVKRYVVQDLDAVHAARAAAIADRDRRADELRATITDPEKRRQLDFWLDAARRGQRGFEDHNYKIDSAASSLLHLAITASARALANAGALESPDDVWWLHAGELTAALRGLDEGPSGETKRPEWKYLVTSRQALHRWYETLTPPPTLGAPPPEEKKPEDKKPEAEKPQRPAPPENVLATGQTGSAGVATGRVRLADKNALVPDVQPGDVLVAHNAGPLWTPIFPTVAAVVLDEGVLFQHAMLTCREYGVPAIFQTKDGSKKLKEGQRVTVDATNAWVLPAE